VIGGFARKVADHFHPEEASAESADRGAMKEQAA
jgi:hypothetical protein